MSGTSLSSSPDLNIYDNGFHRFKVQVWLDNQPQILLSPTTTPPSQRQSPATVINPLKNLKKRKRLQTDNTHIAGLFESADYIEKRKVLHSREMNSTQEPTEHNNEQPRRQFLTRPQKEGQDAIPRRTSPRKHNSSIAEQLEVAVQNDSVLLSRPNLLEEGSGLTMPLQNSYAKDLGNIPLNIVLARPPLSTQTKSSASSRPPSPVKTIKDLYLADPPIHFSEGYGASAECPDVAKTLWCEVLDAAHGSSSVPGFLKDEINDYELNHGGIKVPGFFFDRSRLAEEVKRYKCREWEEVQTIRKRAGCCAHAQDSEAGWGEKVFSRVLEAALQYSGFPDRLEWSNMCAIPSLWDLKAYDCRTSARIAPNSLRPTSTSGNLFQSKMVDYAITLLPDHKLDEQIRLSLRDFPEEHQNINQTPFPPVKFRPISLNIEAKAPGSGKNDMMVQLSIWVAAQFKKLEMLRGAKSVDIGLPLISIEGHVWQGYMAYQVEDGSIRTYGNEVIGSTSSVLGIYKLFSTLRVMARWSDGEYALWLKSNILSRPAI